MHKGEVDRESGGCVGGGGGLVGLLSAFWVGLGVHVALGVVMALRTDPQS